MHDMPHTEEAKEKMRAASKGNTSHLGHKHSEETKRKISESRKGKTAKENNPAWKGGLRSKDYLERRRFKKQIQPKVFARDNYSCQMCGKTGYIQVDHIKGWAAYPELRFEMDNCRTLCMACHYYITFNKELPVGMIWGHNFNKRIER